MSVPVSDFEKLPLRSSGGRQAQAFCHFRGDTGKAMNSIDRAIHQQHVLSNQLGSDTFKSGLAP